MRWYGIDVAEDGWIPLTAIAIVDGAIVHGSGLAWVNTMPPCFLDVASGNLVDFPAALLSRLVELLAAPPRKESPFLWQPEPYRYTSYSFDPVPPDPPRRK